MSSKESVLSRLSWPQVAALGIIVAGAVLTAIFAPIPWESLPWEAILGVALSIGGVGGLAASGPLVRTRTTTPPAPVREKREGFVDVDLLMPLGWLLLWGAAALIAQVWS